jgi:CBS domain-containing protein
MLKVRDIMTSRVTTVSPETTLREAMEIFSREHVSGAPVMSGNRVIGVVSSTDLLGLAAMTRGLPVVPPDDIADAEWREEPDELPDVEGSEDDTRSYFTERWDDSDSDVAERIEGAGPEWNELEEHTVSEVMTRDLWSIESTSSAAAAADMMGRYGIHRVLVVDDGVLVGIISAMDIAKAVADKRFVTRTFVFDRGR